MAESYSDYYTDKNKILAMLEHGNYKERQIALGSLFIHFRKENHYDLAWRIFLSDENMEVKRCALRCACDYATKKQLFEIMDFILQNKLKLNRRWDGDPNFERVIVWSLYQRNYDKYHKK